MTLIDLLLRHSGRRVDRSQPFVDATLPDGSRLHVVIPDITSKYPAINIRKYPEAPYDLNDLVNKSSLTSEAADFLKSEVQLGRNILVAGGTGAGKTTLLTSLLQEVPEIERIVVCEEVREINLTRLDWVSMQTRSASLEGHGLVDLRALIVESLRMRPDRIVVGEVRQREALDLLIALNCGTPGMGTIHANSAREAIAKLTVLPLLAGENVSLEFTIRTVAQVLSLVIFVAKNVNGMRRIVEIAKLTGDIIDGEVELLTIFELRGDVLAKKINSVAHSPFRSAIQPQRIAS
jgi:pilus assembly protein CpaF